MRVELRLGTVGVEQVAGQLRVDVDAGERHAVLGEDHRRLLEAVADLLHRGVLEQRAQRGRYRGPAGSGDSGLVVEQTALRRRRRRGIGGAVRVRERHVARLAGLRRQAEADERGAHRRVAVGDDVERELPGGAALGDERVDAGGLDDGVVALDRFRRRRVLRDERAKRQIGEQLERIGADRAGVAAGVWIEGHRAVGVDRHQRLALARILGMGEQRFAVALLRDLAGPREQPLERAVRRDQIARALLADAGHALDVVGRVAHQRQHVDHLFGRHAELLLHAVGVEPRARLARVVDLDRAADQLEEVLVAGDERDLEAARRGLAGERAHDVVGFVAVRRQDRHAERAAGLVHERHLIDQVGRHRAARRLVVGGEVAAEGRAGQIERRGDELRLVVGDELRQHRDEAVDRVRDLPGGVRHRRQRVVRAVHLVAAVDQEEAGGGHVGRYIIHPHDGWGGTPRRRASFRGGPGAGRARAGGLGMRHRRPLRP